MTAFEDSLDTFGLLTLGAYPGIGQEYTGRSTKSDLARLLDERLGAIYTYQVVHARFNRPPAATNTDAQWPTYAEGFSNPDLASPSLGPVPMRHLAWVDDVLLQGLPRSGNLDVAAGAQGPGVSPYARRVAFPPELLPAFRTIARVMLTCVPPSHAEAFRRFQRQVGIVDGLVEAGEAAQGWTSEQARIGRVQVEGNYIEPDDPAVPADQWGLLTAYRRVTLLDGRIGFVVNDGPYPAWRGFARHPGIGGAGWVTTNFWQVSADADTGFAAGEDFPYTPSAPQQEVFGIRPLRAR